ncbi:DUF4173 domain-containing protein [Microtetraspora sp. AC03309]|uniref:DUF4153 domain-containing protein n=1 Tax=Microtetraspora sp. AC03309 TaxID=2779376 RepID=UPI001E363D8F|nr:DUF4153 domain-containing protein [Microtetraspora sp. AC03309]MCC5574723.1 DUF4173 domain-containing protein [Microtetraspora sp. AC03309]
MRPLDFLGRIKVKLGIVIVLAVVAAFVVNEVGINSGLTRNIRIAIAVVLALIMVQLLARGMTKPLREMAAAAQTIAKGRYGMRVSATSRDEVGELARAFNAMAADLGEVDRQRRELVANVSHELRTPITGLQAVLENVVDGVSTPDVDTLGTALAQTQRLGRLVAQLLDLSRLDSGARLIEAETLDMVSMCRQAAGEAALARDDVTVESRVRPGTALVADPGLLAQVLANLLDNAVRHSPPGGTVRLSARVSGADVEIAVVDGGPGIPPSERARVFERFSRLDAGRAADAGGAGLGLAIAKEIVELHGGLIRIADRPGCHMVIHLPGRAVVRKAAGASAPEPSGAVRSDLPPRTPSVVPPVRAAADSTPEPEGASEATPAAPSAPTPVPVPAETAPAASSERVSPSAEAGEPVVPSPGMAAASAASEPEPPIPSPAPSPSDSSEPVPSDPVPSVAASSGPVSPVPDPAAPPPVPSAPQGPPAPPAYVPPSLFPRPDLPEAPRWMLPAAAMGGLVAAIAMPYASVGLGVALTAAAMGVAALIVLLSVGWRRITPWTVGLALLAYALVSVAIFRDADWLVTPLLLAAFGIAALGVSGAGTGWLGVIRGGLSVVLALPPLPWFISAPTKRLFKGRWLLPALGSAGITVVLLGVFGLLFSSADAVFSAFARDLLQAPGWTAELPYRTFLFGVFGLLVVASVLVGLRPVVEPEPPNLRAPVSRMVWVVPLAGLDLLFASFVTVQITVLFGGSRRVLSTAGLTYAEYARSGFFELVTVSVFVLGVVGAAVVLLQLRGAADRWLLAGLLGPLCAFTLVILASALHRLDLYTGAYGLSRLRGIVEATLWWLAAVFVLVLVAGAVRLARRGTTWFSRTLVLVTGLSLLAFAVWNPEARVAETQLSVRGVNRLDHDYLAGLSAEAVPALDRLPEPVRSCVLRDVVVANGLERPDPWNGWNLARERARDVLRRHPVQKDAECPGPPSRFRG